MNPFYVASRIRQFKTYTEMTRENLQEIILLLIHTIFNIEGQTVIRRAKEIMHVPTLFIHSPVLFLFSMSFPKRMATVSNCSRVTSATPKLNSETGNVQSENITG